MGRKGKFDSDVIERILMKYLNGKRSLSELADEYDITPSLMYIWLNKYKTHGKAAFERSPFNKSYTRDFKERVVKDYIDGLDSFEGLSLKYSIPSFSTVRKWVKQYNGHEELKDYDPKGAVTMTPRRKTSLEERIEIVKYCLDHERSYKHTAEHFDVAYNQVYQWVKKYDEMGELGLNDRRGIHKAPEALNELEYLKRENERLKHQLELKEKESILLKKVKEFERRRYSPKPNKNHST